MFSLIENAILVVARANSQKTFSSYQQKWAVNLNVFDRTVRLTPTNCNKLPLNKKTNSKPIQSHWGMVQSVQ